MIGFRLSRLAVALLASATLGAAAQGTTVDPKAPATTTNSQPATTKQPAKPAPHHVKKKTPPKKAPPKKVDSKAQVTPHGGTVQKYEAGKAPALRDAQGNVIPTSPDAYDVSSASSAPPKKK